MSGHPEEEAGRRFPQLSHPRRLQPAVRASALLAEDKIGTMLPCNVIVQELARHGRGRSHRPVASMSAVENPGLAEIGMQVRAKLQKVVESL